MNSLYIIKFSFLLTFCITSQTATSSSSSMQSSNKKFGLLGIQDEQKMYNSNDSLDSFAPSPNRSKSNSASNSQLSSPEKSGKENSKLGSKVKRIDAYSPSAERKRPKQQNLSGSETSSANSSPETRRAYSSELQQKKMEIEDEQEQYSFILENELDEIMSNITKLKIRSGLDIPSEVEQETGRKLDPEVLFLALNRGNVALERRNSY